VKKDVLSVIVGPVKSRAVYFVPLLNAAAYGGFIGCRDVAHPPPGVRTSS
jgi:hypothetical protein